MGEKTYLKWHNKIGYGSGDIAGNVVYAFLSAFVMIFLTDTVGLNAGIVGTLIAVSKLFDGVSDIFFGSLIDKTHSRMGKARPWMLYGYFGCAACLVAIFVIPADISQFAQYAWFFIAYTLLNAGFYTANNIAYSALTALITKNNHERVQMGSIRFMFAFGTSMLIQTITVGCVAYFGGGASAWRTVAVIYAIVGVISNTLSVWSVKELPPEELADKEGGQKNQGKEETYRLSQAFGLLVHNKYYLMICGAYILMQIYSATLNMGIYFMTYVLKNANLLGVFSWAINIPMIVGLLFTPALVARWKGMYRLNLYGYALGTIGRLGVVAAGYMGSSCRLYGKRSADACVYCGGGNGDESSSGRYECPHRHLFGIYLFENRQAGGRHDVFLHFPWDKAWGRHRNRCGGMAFGIQRICGRSPGTVGFLYQYAPYHVSVAAYDLQSSDYADSYKAECGKGQ